MHHALLDLNSVAPNSHERFALVINVSHDTAAERLSQRFPLISFGMMDMLDPVNTELRKHWQVLNERRQLNGRTHTHLTGLVWLGIKDATGDADVMSTVLPSEIAKSSLADPRNPGWRDALKICLDRGIKLKKLPYTQRK